MSLQSMEKELSKDEELRDDSNWSRDIEDREYYYDDSTGYEVYKPEDEDESEDEDKKKNLRKFPDS